MNDPLPPPLDGERIDLHGAAGRLAVWFAGEGPPLLMVHSVNAAGSAAEVRPVFEHCARRAADGARRTVYALDLPGFGSSERSPRRYTPRLMTDAVREATAAIRARHGGAPVDALALSLGCEFVARAAVEEPAAFGRLALISPTGLRGGRPLRGAPGSTLEMPWLGAVLRGPGWGLGLFRLLTRTSVIRYFLERTWGSRDIDEELLRYDVLTTHQPGAEHAPLAFLEGALFSADIQSVYEALTQPVWVAHGVRGDFTDYRARTLFGARPNWRFDELPSGTLPFFDAPAQFLPLLDEFLARP